MSTEIFVFVLGSEDCENDLYSVEQDTFIVMSYYHNGTFVNGESVYSVTSCKKECLAKYRDLIIPETLFEANIRDVINRFVRTFSIFTVMFNRNKFV